MEKNLFIACLFGFPAITMTVTFSIWLCFGILKMIIEETKRRRHNKKVILEWCKDINRR